MTQSKSDGKSAEAKLVESPAKRQRDELNVYSPPESNRKRRVASSSIQPIPSPSSPKVDEDDLPELGVHLDDFGEFEVQDSEEDEKASPTKKPSETDKAQIYKLQGCRDPEFLKHVEKFSEICLQRLIEEGQVTNRLSENCNKLNIDKFFKENPHCVVYYNPDKPKVGSSTQYQVRLDHLREKNTPGVDEIATVIVGDSLTQAHCDFIEKTRKDLFEAMGVSSELPESLAELMKKPYFFLNVLYHFSEHRNHEYFLMKQETALLESFIQIKFGLETKRESMHEWAAADTPAFENNYNLCWRRSCRIRQVIFDTSGLHMEQLIVMACVLSWKPGDRIGQPIHFLYSKVTIAKTMHPEYIDTYSHDTIPASDKIDDCYNVEFLKPHRSQAQEKCKEVARKIRDAAEPTFTLVDSNKMAFSIDTETNEDVDPEGRHLNFYLSLGFLVVYEDEDAILLYTPNSKSFVYFVGPLCKLLGLFSFKTKANRASSTKRACSAEVCRQLCNMAKGRKDGGRDDFFENIILAHYVAMVLDHQYQADKRRCVAVGKDILTPRHIMSQDRKYSDLPLRTRNRLSLRTRDRTEGRDGASSGDYERLIFYLAMNLMTWFTLEEALQKVYDFLCETGSGLDQKAIYKRLEQFGKKNFIKCAKLRSSWINFCRSKASNRGNRDARGWKKEEIAHGNACIDSLNAEGKEFIQENPNGGRFKIWVETTDKEKKAALEQNTDQNQPNWNFEEHLQMPFKDGGIRNRYKKGENAKLEGFTLSFEKVESGLKNENKPLVTRNNSEYKLLTVVVNPK